MSANENLKPGVALVVLGAEAVIGLYIIWKKVGPQVKGLLKPLYECTKKVLKIDYNDQPNLPVAE